MLRISIAPNGGVEIEREAPQTQAASTGGSAAAPQRDASLVELGVKLVVFDMAGTCVDEGGIVYSTLKTVMKANGLDVPDAEFDAWHGANKKEVVAHFAKTNNKDTAAFVDAVYGEFEKQLEATYFNENSPLKPIPGIYEYFTELRNAGIKIGLDTGFPRKIATHIVERLGFGPYIDGLCVAMDVDAGRPFPFMIYRLMRELKIQNIKSVAKMGDTVRDIEEGQNAGCTYIYGCLTGADSRETLTKAGAYRVVESVVDVAVGGCSNGVGNGKANGGVKRTAECADSTMRIEAQKKIQYLMSKRCRLSN